MMCEDIQSVLETIGPNALPDDMNVTQHLASCDECSALLDASTALDATFSDQEPFDVNDSTIDGLMVRIAEAEEAGIEGDPPSAGARADDVTTQRPWWKRPSTFAIAASIGGVVIVGGLFNNFVGQPGLRGMPEPMNGVVYSTPSANDMTGKKLDRDAPYQPKLQPQRTSTPMAARPMATPALGRSNNLGNRYSPTRAPAFRQPVPPPEINLPTYEVNNPALNRFQHFGVNPTYVTRERDTSTFAVDVDTASYTVARNYLTRGIVPPMASVRVEEFINAFDYDYRAPESGPFSVSVEAFPSPNRTGYHVLHIGVKGKTVTAAQRKPANLVFVIDVSGSMASENRLGLVKQSLGLLLTQLDERDRVGIVVYGSNARNLLESTRATEQGKGNIGWAIRNLSSEGATNASAGLTLGYQMAYKNLKKGHVNRVILLSDGVANTGVTSAQAIQRQISGYAAQGITISTVGFGMNGYNDVLMESLADKGNGNYAYVDNIDEAQRIFVKEVTGTLQVIAKDVKIQLEFDPRTVERYRLLGFENRALTKQQFNDDSVDAGEIGAGHDVTAIYEIKLTEGFSKRKNLGDLRIRYKAPQGKKSQKIAKPLPGWIVRADYASTSPPTKLSMVAGGFAEKLRGSYWARTLSYTDLLEMWGQIPEPLRSRKDVVELRQLILKAQALDHRPDRFVSVVAIQDMDFDRVPTLD